MCHDIGEDKLYVFTGPFFSFHCFSVSESLGKVAARLLLLPQIRFLAEYPILFFWRTSSRKICSAKSKISLLSSVNYAVQPTIERELLKKLLSPRAAS